MMSISEKKISGVEKCPGRETENLICLYAEWEKIRGESNIIHAVCQKKANMNIRLEHNFEKILVMKMNLFT